MEAVMYEGGVLKASRRSELIACELALKGAGRENYKRYQSARDVPKVASLVVDQSRMR